jgi:hypothetical protein
MTPDGWVQIDRAMDPLIEPRGSCPESMKHNSALVSEVCIEACSEIGSEVCSELTRLSAEKSGSCHSPAYEIVAHLSQWCH